jgi:DNA-directed RNA polymerase sigma subunit (sigma70/sigma32)
MSEQFRKEQPEDNNLEAKPEQQELISSGDFLRKIRLEREETLKDISLRENPDTNITSGIQHFGRIETGRNKLQLPEDLPGIAEAYQLTEEQIEELKKINQIETVINDQLHTEEESTNKSELLRKTPGRKEDEPLHSTENEELKGGIDKVLKSLTKREREVIKLRYGLGEDREKHTLEEVSKIVGLKNAERVRQIQLNAEVKLGRNFRRDFLEKFLD